MRGLDIGSILPKKNRRGLGGGVFTLTTGRACCRNDAEGATVALHFGNRAWSGIVSPTSCLARSHQQECPYLLVFSGAARFRKLNRSLPLPRACDLVLLILCKVTLKFSPLQIRAVNAMNSCALQHRRNCSSKISNSILHGL